MRRSCSSVSARWASKACARRGSPAMDGAAFICASACCSIEWASVRYLTSCWAMSQPTRRWPLACRPILEVMRRVPATLALAACLAVCVPAAATAAPLLPPTGKVFTGVTGSTSVSLFQRQTGRHPTVFGFFTMFGAADDFAFRGARQAGSRLMLHVSTQDGYGTREVITPLGIARGDGDHYLLSLNRRIAEEGAPVYVRLLAEMNQANNGYSAFDRSGRSRGPSHSTKAFRNAWRRSALILSGGPVAAIDARLRSLGLPPVQGAHSAELPQPQVALLWVPQTEGSPAIAANAPRAYWPGGRYVDWVGTDFYSRFPNFDKLERFYHAFPGKPFAFGEWALWGRDDPAFVRRLFGWIRSHPRVQMQLYNQGGRSTGPFRLTRYPRSAAAIRAALRPARNLARP